ncbi:transcription factor Sp3 [Aplysia californica]|uniref:Transcription factor Sp3 n=1 Tax=Aplysia californica TaxID=6500 RepID=A0ABM0JHN4_APLCA|nr:transcription factor Sp3 [Aplysia californica]
MATAGGGRGNSDYVVSVNSTQDAQPSPLAMLAATCSKIGSPAQTDEGYGQGGDSGVRMIGAGQGGAAGTSSDAIAGWIQLSNGTIVDSTGKPVVNAGNVIQQATALTNNVGGQLFAQGQQIIATPGPNGQMTYSVLPSYQTVNIDGQDAFIIPSSVGGGGQTQVPASNNVQAAQQTLITPTGQIIRAQGLPAQAASANLFQNVAGFGGLGNLVNIGGNIVNLGGVQNAVRPNSNIMQAVQIPGFQALQQMPNLIQVPVSMNGQTVLQTIQLPAQNIPIQTPLQQVSGNGVVAIGANPQNLQTLMATQTQAQVQPAPQATAAAQPEESQSHLQSQAHNQALKMESKPSLGQLNISHNTTNVSNAAATQSTKAAGMALANASNASAVQTLSVINTPQGQVILSPPANPVQVSQSLPTLTVPSYPQTITANASSSATTTTTSTATQNTPALHNILAQQQLLQGMTNGQNLGGIQLTNQGQINWLQQALNMQAPRSSGVQALQVQNLQGLQNIQTFPALQGLQGLQGLQALTPQGQLINGASVPNLGAVAIGAGGAISAIPLSGQSGTVQAGSSAVNAQGVLTQIQQDPNDPTKWQIVSNSAQATPSLPATGSLPVVSSGPASSSSESTPTGRRLRRVACTCPNCTSTEKVTGENKKKQHICHIQGCGKVYGKTSHLRAHLRWHSGDRPFVCSWLFCGKRFTRSDELQRHKRTHTGDKKFQCPECSKRFMRSDHLSKHIRTHNSKRQLLGDAVSSTQGLDMEHGMDGEDDDEQDGCMIDEETKIYRTAMSEDEEDDPDHSGNVKLESLVV